ncbi:ubiquitin-protein ligase E3 [Schizosaccharomyces japonicus yFS275]|uniref:Ubiquitin-protein ligase E3 n=1 Tax=Schizosaccharomyces japonicus (strain yFS275 / FY16936) TaxID=402676 RepID=B6K4Q3_SCHJY|nr:ubiquitin-protein ligase E3 [Schizosaccharomyces japonicus yFS275]EEB08460.1 ubiquitin-protein ligase E3 [Schizosaccharomyces japonicus yFS275]
MVKRARTDQPAVSGEAVGIEIDPANENSVPNQQDQRRDSASLASSGPPFSSTLSEAADPAETAEVATKPTFEDVAGAVRSSLTCPVCTETFFKPYTTHCGHTYCYRCLDAWIKTSRTCPSCRQKLYLEPVPAYIVNDLISRLSKCMNELQSAAKSDRRADSAAEGGPLFGGVFLKPFEQFGRVFHDAEDGVLRCRRCQWEVENANECLHCGYQLREDEDSNGDSDPETVWSDELRAVRDSSRRLHQQQQAITTHGRVPITAVPDDWTGFDSEENGDDDDDDEHGDDLEDEELPYSGAGEYDMDDDFIDNGTSSQFPGASQPDESFVDHEYGFDDEDEDEDEDNEDDTWIYDRNMTEHSHARDSKEAEELHDELNDLIGTSMDRMRDKVVGDDADDDDDDDEAAFSHQVLLNAQAPDVSMQEALLTDPPSPVLQHRRTTRRSRTVIQDDSDEDE